MCERVGKSLVMHLIVQTSNDSQYNHPSTQADRKTATCPMLISEVENTRYSRGLKTQLGKTNSSAQTRTTSTHDDGIILMIDHRVRF